MDGVFYLEENASLLSRKKKKIIYFSYFFLVHRQKYSSPESSPIALRLLFLVDRSAKSNWIRSSKAALRNHIYCLGKKIDSVFCWQLPAFPVSSFIFYVSFVSSLLLPCIILPGVRQYNSPSPTLPNCWFLSLSIKFYFLVSVPFYPISL